MAEKKRRGTRSKNQFSKSAKVDEVTMIRLVYNFCQGVSVNATAKSNELTAKTVRGVYIALRSRLLHPDFNRWHGSEARFVNLPNPADEFAWRTLFLDKLATCAANTTCARNYRLGNRKARQCRACPLADAGSDRQRHNAYTVIDHVRDFYKRLGIRGEKDIAPTLLFRERLIHTTTVGTVQSNSRKLTNGMFDPNEREFLSGGTLLDMLLSNLADDPL